MRQAYIAGCMAVQANYQEDSDPEFGEAADDYAASLDPPTCLACLALISEVRRLREALEPFAATGAALSKGPPDDACWAGQTPAPPITFGHLRRAALSSQILPLEDRGNCPSSADVAAPVASDLADPDGGDPLEKLDPSRRDADSLAAIVREVRGYAEAGGSLDLSERDALAALADRAPLLSERLQAIIDWADFALSNPQEFDSHGVRNLEGPVFDEARAALATADTSELNDRTREAPNPPTLKGAGL